MKKGLKIGCGCVSVVIAGIALFVGIYYPKKNTMEIYREWWPLK